MSKDNDINILLVDGNPENLFSLESVLSRLELNIVKAVSGGQALQLLDEHEVALVLLGVQAADRSGLKTAEQIKKNPDTQSIPLILVTENLHDLVYLFEGPHAGVIDVATRPLVPEIVRQKVLNHLHVYRQREDHLKTLAGLQSQLDELIESRKMIEQQNKDLSYLSVHDDLTGIYNRRHMDKVLEMEFARAERYNSDLSCILLDLDFFKEVNDTCGHPFGDFVLKEMAASLSGYVRETDYTFRYGGEEFMILLPNTGMAGAMETAEKFRKICEDRIYDNEEHISMITISLGVSSLFHNKPVSPEELISFADKALFKSKSSGRNRVTGYSVCKEAEARSSCKIKNLHERIAIVLEKTKRASIASLELLIRETGGNLYREHTSRVIKYIEMITRELNLPPEVVKTYVRTAALHSCFNILLRDAMQVSSDEFTDADMEKIKKFPSMMDELTKQFDFFGKERAVLMSHREKFDGSGYPKGLKGENIPLGSRIFAVADAYTAMTSERNYKKTLKEEEALQELKDHAGSQFDPEITQNFIHALQAEKMAG